ncbi:hypothetical protein OG948_01810 [Embleya sp. NBC_00888]|uniref:hypothetical protein n=1 Tax=Embleya sp. NBC_00888 TaxID=2975960 RepID=UPI00386E0CDF|nr:hypothetical protein OG948_01810 [Embleya sp. NBC_00888]
MGACGAAAIRPDRESLIQRKYGENCTVEVFDGRGGDQGRDIEVVDAQGRTWI